MLEKEESLGFFLRKEREKNNVSLEQVAYATRIGLKMLKALEEDDHAQLPAPTFVRGYLQAYAKYVRMDAQDLLLRYQHHLATQPGAKKSALRSHYLYVKERYQEKRRLLLIVSLFSMLIVSAGAYFVLKHKRERNKKIAQQAQQIQQAPQNPEALAAALSNPAATTSATLVATTAKDTKETVDKDTKKASESVANTTATTNATTASSTTSTSTPATSNAAPAASTNDTASSAAKKYNLNLKASTDVWMRFQTDDEEVKDIMLREGKIVSLRANKVIKLFSGNLGALQASLNGQEIKSLITPNRAMSAVLPESEVPNYPLPLFPQQQAAEKAKNTNQATNQGTGTAPSSGSQQ